MWLATGAYRSYVTKANHKQMRHPNHKSIRTIADAMWLATGAYRSYVTKANHKQMRGYN